MNDTRCVDCARLRYHRARVAVSGDDQYLEQLICSAGHLVTIADFKRVGSCVRFTRRAPIADNPQAAPLTTSVNAVNTNKETIMPLKAPVTGDHQPVAAGLHPATLVGVYDLGKQKNEMFNTTSHQVLLTFELGDEQREKDGEAYRVKLSKTCTLSLNAKANLRALVDGMLGTTMTDKEAEDFDVFSLAGRPCMATVKHSTSQGGKTSARIEAVATVPRGMTVPPPLSPIVTYNMGDPIPEGTPTWLAEKIAASPDFMGEAQ